MKSRLYVLISVIALGCGVLFFAFNHGWIIIQSPFGSSLFGQSPAQGAAGKKVAPLVFWHNDRFTIEKREIMWPEQSAQAISYLVTSWLSLLEEEGITDKKISLQSAIIGLSGDDLYLSFDGNPLSQEATIFEKWHMVESLLKTLRENECSIKTVQLLVHHQPLVDDHLDFTHPWPLQGFLNE